MSGIYRDPQTGQFQSSDGSGDGENWLDTTAYTGHVNATIPAADLSGGTTDHALLNSSNLALDFSDYLASDEVFQLTAMNLTAFLSLPTTATAESYAEGVYEISRKQTLSTAAQSSFFIGGGSQFGPYDVRRESDESDEVLHIGKLSAMNSFGDSPSGLGAGGDTDRERRQVNFRAIHGSGPFFDQDDEIYVPMNLNTDNISDHAVSLDVLFQARGTVRDLR